MAARTNEAPSNLTVARVVLIVTGTFLVLYSIYRVRSVLMLALVAAFLAVGLDPVVRRLERWKLNRGQAVGVIFAAAVLFLVGFAAAIVPPLVRQVSAFATDLPDYVNDIAKSNPSVQGWIEDNQIAEKLRDATRELPSMLSGSVGQIVGIAGSVVGALFGALTVTVLTIYFLLSLSRIHEGTLRLVPKSRRKRVTELVDPVLEKIGGYIAGNIAISGIAGVVSFLFLLIAGVPYPVALALWVAIADLIPLVGATLGAIPAVVVAFVDSLGLGIAAAIFFLIYQQVENYVIAPRVMTKAVDLSPAAVLLAALTGATLLGPVGALMAIPAAAAIKLIVQDVVLPHTETS